jgi:hypothetical protein
MLQTCEEGYGKEKSPIEIIDYFFKQHTEVTDEKEKMDHLFKYVQYMERQVVLFDAIEDAAFTSVNDIEGAGSIKALIREATFAGKMQAFKNKLKDFKVRIVLTAHPTQFYPSSVLGIIHDMGDAIAKNDYSSRVIDLFNYGYSKLSTSTDLICKLDADVSLDKDYFKNISLQFEVDPKLAIASGHLHIDGVPEKMDADQLVCTRGATKVYRTGFLHAIGGLISYQGWDTLDNVAARAKGWHVMIVDEPFEHLKEEGVRVGKTIFRHVRNGYYNGSLPFYFPYFLIKIIARLLERPIFFSSLFMLWGYVKARFSQVKSPYPEYVIEQLRKEQKSYLMKKIKLI